MHGGVNTLGAGLPRVGEDGGFGWFVQPSGGTKEKNGHDETLVEDWKWV